MQKDITNDRALHSLTEEFRERLNHLATHGYLRHGIAAMALAMQEELTRYSNWGKVAHGECFELILRGIYTGTAGTGEKDLHPIEKISLGYQSLMASYNEDRREEIVAAFKEFEKVLKGR